LKDKKAANDKFIEFSFERGFC